MPKPRVYCSHELFEEARKTLEATCDVEYWTEGERPGREEVLWHLKDKEGLVCLLTEKVDEGRRGCASARWSRWRSCSPARR